MSITHDDLSPSRVQADEPEEPAVSGFGSRLLSLRDKLRRWWPFGKDEESEGDARRKQAVILASVVSLAVVAALVLWLILSGYEFLSRHFASDVPAAKPAAAKEVQEPAGSEEYEKAKLEAQRALEEAERERQLNVARMQADKYEWERWQQTLRDVEENKKRLSEKQRAADEKAEEEARLARIEEQKKAEAAQRIAAEMAPAARAAARTKKRMKTFD